ncbi:hypothetical protein DIC82_00770 [Clostridium beijerinckii]|nr:hypothetical protein DIC82_00770 [Clostridium beijerinckii]
MNGQIKRYIYIIGTICMVFLVGSIFIRILPWLILIGVIGYIIMKIIGFIKVKKEQKNSNDIKNNYRNQDINKESTDDYTDYTNGEIIDVEYEDIDDKEK